MVSPYSAGVTSDQLRKINSQFDNIYSLAFKAAPVTTGDVVQVKPAKSHYVTMAALTQVPKMQKWLGEKQLKQMATLVQTVRSPDFEATIAIDRNEILSDNVGMYSELPAMLGVQGAKHQDQLFAQTLQCGVSENVGSGNLFPNESVTTSIADGLKIFSTAHTWPGVSTTQSNVVTGSAINAALVGEACNRMMGFLGDDGQPINVDPFAIVYGPTDQYATLNAIEARLNPVVGSNATVPLENIIASSYGLKPVLVRELANEPGVIYLLGTVNGVKPVHLYDFIPPHLVPMVNPESANVFYQKSFVWSLEANRLMVVPLWFLLVRVTTIGY